MDIAMDDGWIYRNTMDPSGFRRYPANIRRLKTVLFRSLNGLVFECIFKMSSRRLLKDVKHCASS